LIVKVNAALAVPCEFVALIVMAEVPVAVGVPVMAPVVVLMENPVGSGVAA
jgi:hypothetical protein